MARKKRLTAKRRQTIRTCVFLAVCFPYGLFLMWTKTRWRRSVRIGVTALIAIVLAVILVPMTNPPERMGGGVKLVGRSPEVEVLGPEAPEDREVVEIYAPRRTAIIVAATPTPAPVYVYCNAGGQYYHAQGCKWVGEGTPQATLTQALNAGYKPCPECDAPAAIG